MPRVYKSKSSRHYKKYDPSLLKIAINAYKTEKKSLREIASQYNIGKSVLYRHAMRKMKCPGGQRCLSEEEEKYITKFINICSKKGYLMDTYNFRLIIKQYLDTSSKQIKKFTNNLPSLDFAKAFFKRYSKEIPEEITKYRKWSRAKICPETTNMIRDYFKEFMNTEKIPSSYPGNDADDDKKDHIDTAAFSLMNGMGYGQTTSTSNNVINHIKSKEDINLIYSSNSSEVLDNKSEEQLIPIENIKTDFPRVSISERPRTYKKYDPLLLKNAINAYKTKNKPLREIACQYNIAKSVLYRHATRKMKCPGGQRCLSEEEEKYIIKFINICSKKGYLMDTYNFRLIIKQYLDTSCKQKKKFTNNLPSLDFAKAFFKRYSKEIPEEITKYRKWSRPKISPETTNMIQDYFKEYMNTGEKTTSCPGNDGDDDDDDDKNDDVDEAVLFLLREMGYGQAISSFNNFIAVKSKKDIDFKHITKSNAALVDKSEKQQISIEINKLDTKTKKSTNHLTSLVYERRNKVKNVEEISEKQKLGTILIKYREVIKTKQIVSLEGSPDSSMTNKNITVVLKYNFLVSKNVPVHCFNDQEETPISYEEQTDDEDKIIFIVI